MTANKEHLFELSAQIGEMLTRKNLTVSTAESCTGGLLGHVLTGVSGSSAYYLGGVISYSNSVKAKILGVNYETLLEHGAVSHQTAQEMAEGTRERLDATIGLSTTGVAGPTGGTPEKPVGLVYIGISTENDTQSYECHFSGDREDIKESTVKRVLELLSETLTKADEENSIVARKKKILILTGDAGMGHRSAAEAVQKALCQKYSQHCDVEIINPLNHPKVPGFIRESETDYDKIVKRVPELYQFGYDVLDSNLPATMVDNSYAMVLFEAMREILIASSPDLVITTYPLYQAAVEAFFRLNKKDIPFITIVTDLANVHHIWFNKNSTLTVVPTQSVLDKALESGMKPNQLMTLGIPVNPRISELQQEDQAQFKQALGIDPEEKTLLVVGSPRISNLDEKLSVIDQSSAPFQMIVVTGGNKKLFETLKKKNWQHPTKVFDFVEDMPVLMRASDLIACKAGGLIVTESLASGLPLLLIHALPGQEIGNVEYVVEHNAGAFCKTDEEIQSTLTDWLGGSADKLQRVAENAREIGKKDAAYVVADKAWTLLNAYQPQPITPLIQKRIDRLQVMLERFNIPWI
jgi:1,2-diacylglycerol 3-beta-galactosyltransferase